MRTTLAGLTELGAQLEKLRGAIESARRGRERRAPGAVRRALRSPRGPQPQALGEARAPRSGFVEFRGAQLMEAPVGTVVELANVNGVRLTIRLAAGQPLDVAAMVALFSGAQR